MKKTTIVVLIFLLAFLMFIKIKQSTSGGKEDGDSTNNLTKDSVMKISSPIFQDQGTIPAKYTCDGENISPELIFSEIPENTKTLALIMEDPDVPKTIREDGMWNHWVVFDIPASATGIGEGELAPGITGLSSRNVNEYGGPCPPDREHRYFFKLFALDKELKLSQETTKDQLLEAMQGSIIDQAQLMGRYERIKGSSNE